MSIMEVRFMNGLRKKRLLSGLTQYDIEKLTGIPQGKLSLIERGYREPSDHEKKKLTKVLRIEV